MQGFYGESFAGKEVPQVFVTLKTGEGIGENRFQLAILESPWVFTCELIVKEKTMKRALFIGCLLLVGLAITSPLQSAEKLPNFVLIFCDDLGY